MSGYVNLPPGGPAGGFGARQASGPAGEGGILPSVALPLRRRDGAANSCMWPRAPGV